MLKVFMMICLLSAVAQAGYITGRVTDQNGQPIFKAFIEGHGRNCWKNVILHTRTNSSGYYVLQTPGRPCFVTTLRARHPDFVFAHPQEAVFLFFAMGQADFVLERAPAAEEAGEEKIYPVPRSAIPQTIMFQHSFEISK